MGFGSSKFKGSLVFAYLLNTTPLTNNDVTTTTTLIQEQEEDDDDFLLQNPQGYGLSKYRHQRDSGYYDERLQVDLNYIDTTYYPVKPAERTIVPVQPPKRIIRFQQKIILEANYQISFSDLLRACDDKSLRQVYLPYKSIERLSPNIGMLTMIRKLDLSNNHLIELPDSIGYMQCLETLDLTRNDLTSLPDTIGYLSNLIELDLSFNYLTTLTPCISYLEKLKTLSLAHNQLDHLTHHISGLTHLISLDLTNNPLNVLPAEISKLPFLRRIRFDNCPFKTDQVYPLKHNPPSLLEICARTVSKKNMKYKSTLPPQLSTYVQTAKSCSSCQGPYYDSFVLRGRLMEKTDVDIPLEYRLCSAHWSDGDDRILSMFSKQPVTFHPKVRLPYRPKLPTSSPKSFDSNNKSCAFRKNRHFDDWDYSTTATVDNQPTPPTKLNQYPSYRLNRLTAKFKKLW